jgi:hypothetical protein
MKLNSQTVQRCRIRSKKKNSSQPILTCQTLYLGHETEITSKKASQNKLWSLILNQFKWWRMKLKIKFNYKKELKKQSQSSSAKLVARIMRPW